MTIFTDIGPVGHVNSEANIDLISDALVGPTVVEQGGLFILQCDPSIAGITSTDENLYTLYIEWTNGTSKLQELASYNSIEPPYTSQNPPKTYPARKWSFKFSGGLDDRSSNFFQKNSKKLKKIEISVYDANCADAGFYFCRADLPYAGDYFMRHHNLTVVGKFLIGRVTVYQRGVGYRCKILVLNLGAQAVYL
ncbi:uncharacterized protein LOC131945863 [Physella acuta]|uniref:uncharacterized protein LOC131945863 n=1 Tax=Physella acuta TaxID=109671 RepID=UPI0027DC69DD|nr:uncharacterized protein LOC131945863 [Physella acuta]